MLHDIGRINNSENVFSLNDKRLAPIYPTNIHIISLLLLFFLEADVYESLSSCTSKYGRVFSSSFWHQITPFMALS